MAEALAWFAGPLMYDGSATTPTGVVKSGVHWLSPGLGSRSDVINLLLPAESRSPLSTSAWISWASGATSLMETVHSFA